MKDLNITPFIDVLLVLLILLIMTIPIATHVTEVDLPGVPPLNSKKDFNLVTVTEQGEVLWNGTKASEATLRSSIAYSLQITPKPGLRFLAEPRAPYDLSARTIHAVKIAGAKEFAFMDLHRHRDFGTTR